MNGRHLILLGLIACVGLLSVHEGQQQIELCYHIAAIEKDMRGVRSEIDLCKIKFQALQSPKAVVERATELKLRVEPALPAASVSLRPAVSPAPQIPQVPLVPQVPKAGNPLSGQASSRPASGQPH